MGFGYLQPRVLTNTVCIWQRLEGNAQKNYCVRMKELWVFFSICSILFLMLYSFYNFKKYLRKNISPPSWSPLQLKVIIFQGPHVCRLGEVFLETCPRSHNWGAEKQTQVFLFCSQCYKLINPLPHSKEKCHGHTCKENI